MSRPPAYRVMLELGTVADVPGGRVELPRSPTPGRPELTVTLMVDPAARARLIDAIDVALDLLPGRKDRLAKPGNGWRLDFVLQLVLARCRGRDQAGRLVAPATSANTLLSGELAGRAGWGKNNVFHAMQLLERIGFVHRSQHGVGTAGDVTLLTGPSDDVALYQVDGEVPQPLPPTVWRGQAPAPPPVDNWAEPVDGWGPQDGDPSPVPSPHLGDTVTPRGPTMRGAADGGAGSWGAAGGERAGQRVSPSVGDRQVGVRPHEPHVMDEDAWVFDSFDAMCAHVRHWPDQLAAVLREGRSVDPPVRLGWYGPVEQDVVALGADVVVEALHRLGRKLATGGPEVVREPGAWLRQTATRLAAERAGGGPPPSSGTGAGGGVGRPVPAATSTGVPSPGGPGGGRGAGPVLPEVSATVRDAVMPTLAQMYGIAVPPDRPVLVGRLEADPERAGQLVAWAAGQADRKVGRHDTGRLVGPPEWVIWLFHFLDEVTSGGASER